MMTKTICSFVSLTSIFYVFLFLSYRFFPPVCVYCPPPPPSPFLLLSKPCWLTSVYLMVTDTVKFCADPVFLEFIIILFFVMVVHMFIGKMVDAMWQLAPLLVWHTAPTNQWDVSTASSHGISIKIRDMGLCERGNGPGFPSLIVCMVSVDVKLHWRGTRKVQKAMGGGGGNRGNSEWIKNISQR